MAAGCPVGELKAYDKKEGKYIMKKYVEYVDCEACGCTGVPDSIYEKPGRGSHHAVMRRVCKRCGYEWYELPLNEKI